MNLLEIVVKGGWVMIPIGIASIMVVAIGIGRYLTIQRERKTLNQFVREWEHRRTDPAAYRTACELGPQLPSHLAVLYSIDRGKDPVRYSEL